MKNYFNKFLFLLWALTWYFSTVCGISVIIEKVKWLNNNVSFGVGMLFATCSFCYVIYKYEKLREPKQ